MTTAAPPSIEPAVSHAVTVGLGPGTKATRTALTLSEGLRLEEWQAIVERVLALSDASTWWIGDALAYGEWRYGEKYRSVLAGAELEYDRVRDYAYVAGNVPAPVRRAELSFKHHRIVAKLIPADQERWLAAAASHGWSYRELQERIERDSGGIDPPPAPLEQLRFTVDAGRLERWQTAAERAHASVSEWALDVLDRAAGAT